MNCAHCGNPVNRPSGEINRALRLGNPIYCDRACAGLGRRKNYTEAEKKEIKRLYDIEYRDKNREARKAKAKEYFKRTYDPAKAAVERKKNMPRHIEYCRRPEYKVWKKNYDRLYRLRVRFGDFAEAAMLLQDIEQEVDSRSTFTERESIKGTLNKSQRRKRDYERLNCNKP